MVELLVEKRRVVALIAFLKVWKAFDMSYSDNQS